MSEKVIIEIGGNIVLKGLVTVQSEEIVVLFDGKDYLYIMREHLRIMKHDTDEQEITWPQISQVVEGELNIEQLLQNSRNFSLELVVLPGKVLHGKVGAVLDDYFEFHTPLFKTLYIAKKHVKWFIPYETEGELVAQKSQRLERSLILQLAQLKGEFVQLNQRSEGRIVNVKNDILELEHARGAKSFVNIRHVQIVWVNVKAH